MENSQLEQSHAFLKEDTKFYQILLMIGIKITREEGLIVCVSNVGIKLDWLALPYFKLSLTVHVRVCIRKGSTL